MLTSRRTDAEVEQAALLPLQRGQLPPGGGLEEGVVQVHAPAHRHLLQLALGGGAQHPQAGRVLHHQGDAQRVADGVGSLLLHQGLVEGGGRAL